MPVVRSPPRRAAVRQPVARRFGARAADIALRLFDDAPPVQLAPSTPQARAVRRQPFAVTQSPWAGLSPARARQSGTRASAARRKQLLLDLRRIRFGRVTKR